MNQRCRPQCDAYPARCRTRCDACRYMQQCPAPSQPCPTPLKPCPAPSQPCPTPSQPCATPVQCSTPVKTHYFYLEKTSTPDDTLNKKKTRSSASRPSSADSVKSSLSNKRGSGVSSKFASSDSKILKKKEISKNKISPLKNREAKKPKIDPESVLQLKNDMNAVKEQLLFLAQNRNDTLNASAELQIRYQNLLKQNQDQQKVIEDLKAKNEMLIEKINDQQILEGRSINEAIATKNCLDQYEATLNTLYDEFVDSTKVMEERLCYCSNRRNSKKVSIIENDLKVREDKACPCYKRKNSKKESDFGNDSVVMVDKACCCCNKGENSNSIESDPKYEKLLKNYKKAKEKERRYEQQNEELTQTVEELENQLNQSVMELEIFRNEAIAAAQRQEAEMAEKSKRYAYQLEIKGQEISELSRAVEELKNQTCSCDAQSEDSISLANKYDELMAKYQEAANKLKMYEETNSQRFREIQLLKKKEKDLVAQMAKLQKNLTTTSNNNNLTIAELNSSKQEKCSIIQCQKNELACKNKQIEILLKNEEKLKKRIVQLQEELVSIKITDTNRNDQAVVLTAQDCSIHLTDELQDLITALYEEIDKALAKDEHIQQQNRNICCLQCALSSKEKELTCVRNELKILKEQFTSTLKEKQTLTDQLQNVEVQNATYEEERFSRKCYCEI